MAVSHWKSAYPGTSGEAQLVMTLKEYRRLEQEDERRRQQELQEQLRHFLNEPPVRPYYYASFR